MSNITLFFGVRCAHGRTVENNFGGPNPRLILGGEPDGGRQQSGSQRCGGGLARAFRPRQRHDAHAQRGPAPLGLHAAVRHATSRQL